MDVMGMDLEALKKRVVEKVKRQAEEAFESGYKWLYERVDSGELDYDDLCTIEECEDASDIAFFFVGDHRDPILRLRRASPEFLEGVKKAVSEILMAIRKEQERTEESKIFD